MKWNTFQLIAKKYGWVIISRNANKDYKFTKKEFLNDYKIDWKYGDSNHGATIKCIQEGKQFYHMRPYYDNPNFPTPDDGLHTYYHDGKKFGTHLKGGISENKMSNRFEVKKWLSSI